MRALEKTRIMILEKTRTWMLEEMWELTMAETRKSGMRKTDKQSLGKTEKWKRKVWGTQREREEGDMVQTHVDQEEEDVETVEKRRRAARLRQDSPKTGGGTNGTQREREV